MCTCEHINVYVEIQIDWAAMTQPLSKSSGGLSDMFYPQNIEKNVGLYSKLSSNILVTFPEQSVMEEQAECLDSCI